jgi:NADPH:quinone reductase-like Zn-dependent oxidoreductase
VREDVALPELGASEVLVRTHAIGVNPLDLRVSMHFVFSGPFVIPSSLLFVCTCGVAFCS